MDLDDLAAKAYDFAHDAGWHDKDHGFVVVCRYGSEPQRIPVDRIAMNLALIHSEVSEALEALKKNRMGVWECDENGKPISFDSELADIAIRTAELAEYVNMDLDQAVQRKMAYNATRLDVPAKDDTKAF